MASEEEVVRFIFNGANEMAELAYHLIRWALERRDKGKDDAWRDPSKINGRIAKEDAAGFAADLASAGIEAEYVVQADGGLVYSCDARHFETIKALTKGYAAKYDAMHPDSVDNVYYETLRDWRGCSLNECFEVASTVEVAAVNKMRADLAAMGVYFEVARRPENLGYVVKFNAKDASLVERALCELDQAYGHPQSAQDVARAIAGYLPPPTEARSADRDEARSTDLGSSVGAPRQGAAKRDLDGRKAGDYTLTMTTVEWDRAADIMAGPMKEDGIPFSRSVDEMAETASFTFASEHAAAVKAIADRYIGSQKESLKDFTPSRFEGWDEFCIVAETGMVRDDVPEPRQERVVERADYAVEPRDVGPSETVETVAIATKTEEVAEGSHVGQTLEEMTNPGGLAMESIERFGAPGKLDGAKIGDVLQACSKDVQTIKAQIESRRQQGAERAAKAVAQAKGPVR